MALLGFRRLAPSKKKSGKGGGGGGMSGFSPTETVRFLKAQALKQTPGGEFTNIAQVDNYIKAFEGLPYDPQNEIAKEEALVTRAELVAKKQDVDTSISQLETDLQNGLNARASSGSFTNPYALSYDYAEVYSMAEDLAQQKIDELYTTGRDTEENVKTLRAAKDKYGEKRAFYNDLRVAYYGQNSRGEIGPENPEEYAYIPQINPATGKMSSVEIVRVSDIKDKGYLKADTPIRTAVDEMGTPGTPLQLYLPTYKIAETEEGKPIMGARFGDITYRQVDTNEGKKKDQLGRTISTLSNTLVAEEKPEGGFFGLGADTAAQQYNATIKGVRTNGIVLNQDAFDSKDPGNGTLLRYSDHIFYKGDDGKVVEFVGGDKEEKEELLKTYLKDSGKDQQTISNIVSRPHIPGREILDQVTSKNYVDRSYLTPSAPPAVEQVPMTPGAKSPMNAGAAWSGAQAVGKAAGNLVSGAAKFFAGRESKPNKPDAAPESSNGQFNVADVVAKGKSFFASQFPK